MTKNMYLRHMQKVLCMVDLQIWFFNRSQGMGSDAASLIKLVHLRTAYDLKFEQIQRTNATLFRMDKPKIDPRRVSRAERKKPKGQTISINRGGRGVDATEMPML